MTANNHPTEPLEPVALGRIQIFPLLDAVGSLPLGFFFQADKQKPMLEKLGLWKQLLEGSGEDPEITKIPFRGFLLKVGETKILFDLGIGKSPLVQNSPSNNMLMEELQKTGTSVEDIQYVVLSHLHADHTGWVVHEDGTPTFPNADYLVTQDEIDYWGATEAGRKRVFYDQRIAPLLKSPQLKPLKNEAKILLETDGMTLELVPLSGHTPGHMVLRAQDTVSNDTAYFIGDALHFDSQAECPSCSINGDVDPLLAAENRAKLLKWAETENAMIVAAHLKGTGCVRVDRKDGKRVFVPVE